LYYATSKNQKDWAIRRKLDFLSIYYYMHTKHKGNIAYSSVVLELQKHEFNVFAEIGDYSKIDLIAEKSGILKKFK